MFGDKCNYLKSVTLELEEKLANKGTLLNL